MTGQLKGKGRQEEDFIIEDGIMYTAMGEEIPLNLDDTVMEHHRFEAMAPHEALQLVERTETAALHHW